MRNKLRSLCSQHIAIRAKFICVNEVVLSGREPCQTMLLHDVRDDVRDDKGTVLTTHAWIKLLQNDDALGLLKGDEVTMQVEVQAYVKGYRTARSVDYQLVRPRAIQKVAEEIDASCEQTEVQHQ